MALSFPAGYSSNLDADVTENYLVRLYNEDGNFIALSLNDTTVNSINYDGVLKKAPTIRESIDIQKTSSSLSNVTIDAVNFNFTTSGNVTLSSSAQLDQELLFGENYYKCVS